MWCWASSALLGAILLFWRETAPVCFFGASVPLLPTEDSGRRRGHPPARPPTRLLASPLRHHILGHLQTRTREHAAGRVSACRRNCSLRDRRPRRHAPPLTAALCRGSSVGLPTPLPKGHRPLAGSCTHDACKRAGSRRAPVLPPGSAPPALGCGALAGAPHCSWTPTTPLTARAASARRHVQRHHPQE